MKFVKFLKDQMYPIVISLMILAGIAGFYHKEIFIALKWTLPIALFAMLFKPMMFLDVKKAFTKGSKEKTKYLTIITVFYLAIVPLLTYGLLKLMLVVMPNVSPKLLAGVVLISLAPIASSAPAFTSLAGGKVQLTLLGVILTFFLSIFVMPLYAKLILHTVIAVPIWLLIESLIIYIIIPLIVGQIVRYAVIKTEGEKGLKSWNIPLTGLSLLGMYWMIIIVFGINGKAIGKNPSTMIIGVVIMIAYFLVRMVLAYTTGKILKLPLQHNISLFYSESSNMTLSTAIAIGTFGSLAAVGCVLGGPFSDMIIMILSVKFFQKKVEKAGEPTEEKILERTT